MKSGIVVGLRAGNRQHDVELALAHVANQGLAGTALHVETDIRPALAKLAKRAPQGFADEIDMNYPSHDYDDLMSVVDAAIAKGSVDSNQLFVTGGSGGGLLTAWIVGKTGRFKAAVGVPILANITEFGMTPIFTKDELASADVDIVLYCCSAYRAMNAAALKVYEAIRAEGTQKNVVDTMQTRADLYQHLGYHAYEEKLDALFARGK